MAQEKIIIRFEPKGHKPLLAALKKLEIQQKKLLGTYKESSKSTGILDTKTGRLRDKNTALANSFATLRSKMLLFNFAMAMGIKQLIDFTLLAAKVESMGRAFDTLSGGSENASIAMDKLKQATDGTMSQFDLFQQANNAMILGVSRNSDEMAEMFDIAQRLGRALGRDTASSVESLITGIGRQSRLMLDNIGIIVKADEAYEAYARELKTTADNLTDAEKKQAFLSATMESARGKVSSLGEEVLVSQDSFDRLSAAVDDTTVALGDKFKDAFAGVADSIADFLTKTQEINTENKASEVVYGRNAMAVNLFAGAFNFLGESMINLSPGRVQLRALNRELLVLNDLYRESPLAPTEDPTGSERPIGGMDVREYKPLSDENMFKHELYIEYLKIMNESTKKLNQTRKDFDFSEWEKRMQKQVDLAEGLADAIARSVLQANSFNSAIKTMGNVIIEEAKRIVAQEAASWLIKSVFSMFGGPLAGIGAGMQTLEIFHQGGLISEKKPVQRFATGGTVQGGDNVPILAQGGEFVMSRSAVESVGIENLNRMNQGGGGAINVSIQGNLLTEEYVETELAEKISTAVRRGVDFGIS